ncbi:MBL fold metallo-hydrolase [Virgibacillus sp. 6R]|uniref:MBL fold metallo-hydrolase n=1 Tax=Metabacillus sp. 22489 TaxID=3453928 RepID=UPI0011AA1BA2
MKIKSLQLFECGYCTHPEKIILSNGSFKSVKFPATVALLNHETYGYILFDTGYASHFLEATKRFPFSAYAKITPVTFTETKSIKYQLEEIGINQKQINYIILSHFHGDHTAGLKDFPYAKILTFKKAYEHIVTKSKFQALTKGCLLELLPENIEERLIFIDEMDEKQLSKSYGDFSIGYDVFEDESVIAIDLTGHAIGQFGIFVNLQSGKRVLLCADAVWVSEAFEQLIFPHWIANVIIEDVEMYRNNLKKLNQLWIQNPEIDILPTHCHKTWEKVKQGVIYE